mmetsp:Transcript_42337/g.45956  ORF Transcript_42337/g.45956 Transcript_42337/m.45956 type:complete len:254 (+) Transcript_42337:106-867(+)
MITSTLILLVTMTMMLTIPVPFVCRVSSFSTTTTVPTVAPTIMLSEKKRRRTMINRGEFYFHHIQFAQIRDDDYGENESGTSESGTINDRFDPSISTRTETEMVVDEFPRNNNSTTTTTTTMTVTIALLTQFRNEFVSLKEKVYRIIRQLFRDLFILISRSVKKGQDWDIDNGQLVSSSLILIVFFAAVAAFAAWNIEVLSGGKSQWKAPTNGITVPVIRGVRLPSDDYATTKKNSITIQKPNWKIPKIQTSY